MKLITKQDFLGSETHIYTSSCGLYRLYIHPYEHTSMEYESIHEIRWVKFIDGPTHYDHIQIQQEEFHNEYGASHQLFRHNADIEGDGPCSLIGDIDHDTYYIDGKKLTYSEWIDASKLTKDRKILLKLKK